MRRFATPLSDNDNDNWSDYCSLAVKPKEIKCERGVTSLKCLDVSINLCFEYAESLKFHLYKYLPIALLLLLVTLGLTARLQWSGQL